jgi:hypothetical protein
MKLLARYVSLAAALALVAFGCGEEPDFIQAPATTGTGPFTSATDGTETLGNIPIPLEDGTGIAIGGVGTRDSQPGTIRVTVPGTATVKQVLVYWQGDNPTGVGDDQITVEGNNVIGTLIGGPTLFYVNSSGEPRNGTTFRADITSLGLVTAGVNNLDVSGMNFAKNEGAGIVVIYDDGSGPSDILVKDGQDLAYHAFTPPLNTTVPQTFTFAAASVPRQATLSLLASSVEENRPNVVAVTIDATTNIVDPFQSFNGSDFDAYQTTVNIPAGATQMTLQCLSEKDPSSSLTGDAASLTWLCAALSLPLERAAIGDFVWLDEDQNGIQDDGENGIPGLTVYLFECGEQTPLANATTDGNGFYLFSNLVPGDYALLFTLAPGLEFTQQNQGADDALDSEANETTGATVCTTLDPGETDLTWDAGMFEPEEILSCRMTGGGNAEAEETIPDRIGNGNNINVYSFGGQAGAPTALQPQPRGEWTHTQKRGPAGSFTFHGGTSSSPPETEIDWITCSDPGWCVEARPAPAKQLDFAGVGTFHNTKDLPPSIADFVVVGESLHWFEVNIDDLGEPGKSGHQQPPAQECDVLGYGRNGSEEFGNCDCPDFYRIQIFAGPDENSPVIYEAHGYIEGGNLQIHPLTGHDRKNFDSDGGGSKK